MRVIGTAGHVDHGKSTLIAALTGTHPDRLKEEQAREMTIELGFGWLTLPNGEEVGIVDVPGHRDFIENMLSGIGGIDAALLVIAADEGVMPQTREHLAILDLLQIPAGLIVLTKTDIASDSTWLDLLEIDIRGAVSDTVLANAPIIRVSAKNRTGLDLLITTLSKVLESKPARLDINRPRLPIDRVFNMSGFGTVVTGTLNDGHLSIGDEVEILPGGLRGRIRGLQTHKRKEETAVPGSRTAVNISGVDTELVQRGEVVVHPGQYQATRRVDARFRLLKDASLPARHGDEVKFFVGASETIATLRLLGTEELKPGEEGWIQLEMRDPLVAVRGDKYILRRPSPSETLGGGLIIDHQPKGRHKRFDEEVLKSFEALMQGSPSDILFEAALALNIAGAREVVAKSRLESVSAQEALDDLLQNDRLIALEAGQVNTTSDLLVMALPHWNEITDRVDRTLSTYHEQFPLRRGISREELKSRLKMVPRSYNAVLSQLSKRGLVIEEGNWVAKAGHGIRFGTSQQAQVRGLMRKFELNPYSPPSVKECHAEAGEEVVNALIELKELIPVSADVIFRKSDYDEMLGRLRASMQERGEISLAEVRDLFNTTRKYAQAFLEHLDTIGITIRDGDFRKLKIR
ncbi:MAG: selenocysteine-specific translation elongation factor [Chloroflexi bacterium]|nr:selenocysteine-specific translation elongation factor [Chloroflexota bacterium]